MNAELPTKAAFRKRQAKFRLAGTMVLMVGLAGSCLVYWLGSRSVDRSDDPSMLKYNQPQERQMEMLYGKQGRLIQELTDTLEQPGTRAFLVAATSVIVASFCFYFARTSSTQHPPDAHD